MILKYCDMFLKLKDLCDSTSFKEADTNHDGTVFPKDFKIQLEKSKKYTRCGCNASFSVTNIVILS